MVSFTTIIIIFQFYFQNRHACLISRGDTFVITGGANNLGFNRNITKNGYVYNATDRVSLYSSDGWVRDLDSLITGRQRHGCASFTDSNGQEVRMSSRTDKTMFILT